MHSPLSFCKIDVSFPEKLQKIVATTGEIFSLKFTKYRLAAGLRMDPLGELKRSPRSPSRNKGGLLLRRGKGREEGKEGMGKGRGKGKGRGTEGGGKKGGEGEGGTCSKVLGGIDAPVSPTAYSLATVPTTFLSR